jgi:hypothetical protein
MDVEVEPGGGEGAVEVGQLVERPVEQGVVEVVRDGHVRVVGVVELGRQGAAPARVGELLGLRDPLDQVDEDDRGDRTERAGAAEVDPVGGRRPGHGVEVSAHLDEPVAIDLQRWHEGDVGRDRGALAVAVAHPEVLEPAAPRLRHTQGDTDGPHGA